VSKNSWPIIPQASTTKGSIYPAKPLLVGKLVSLQNTTEARKS
jgi:hypothetical protein